MTKKFFIGIVFLVFACEEVKIPEKIVRKEEPVSQTYGFYYLYTDSGKTKAEITAPYVKETYENKEEHITMTEFPKGIDVRFYNKNGEIESRLRARYAKIYNKQSRAYAKGNVVLENLKEGNKLETEELFWERKTDKIKTDKTVKITTREEVLVGKGLEATTDFKYYKLSKITGTFKVKIDE